NGWARSGPRRLRRSPIHRRTPSPVSTSEWMPSEVIAELPVRAAAANFTAAIARFAATAASTAIRRDGVVTGLYSVADRRTGRSDGSNPDAAAWTPRRGRGGVRPEDTAGDSDARWVAGG